MRKLIAITAAALMTFSAFLGGCSGCAGSGADSTKGTVAAGEPTTFSELFDCEIVYNNDTIMIRGDEAKEMFSLVYGAFNTGSTTNAAPENKGKVIELTFREAGARVDRYTVSDQNYIMRFGENNSSLYSSIDESRYKQIADAVAAYANQ